MRISRVERPQFYQTVVNTVFDSTFHDIGMEHISESVYANALMIAVDLYEDGSKIAWRGVRFCDHVGLEQEWLDGTSATVLDAVLQSVVDSMSDKEVNYDSTNPSIPTPYQRSQTISKSYTPTLS